MKICGYTTLSMSSHVLFPSNKEKQSHSKTIGESLVFTACTFPWWVHIKYDRTYHFSVKPSVTWADTESPPEYPSILYLEMKFSRDRTEDNSQPKWSLNKNFKLLISELWRSMNCLYGYSQFLIVMYSLAIAIFSALHK